MESNEELEALGRAHTAELAVLTMAVQAIIAALPKEGRLKVREGFRLALAERLSRLADAGFDRALDPAQIRALDTDIRQAAMPLQAFLDG